MRESKIPDGLRPFIEDTDGLRPFIGIDGDRVTTRNLWASKGWVQKRDGVSYISCDDGMGIILTLLGKITHKEDNAKGR